MRRKEVIEMSRDEFDAAVERAAKIGARRVLKEVRQLFSVQLASCGVVDRQMIANAYGVDTDTVTRWEERHNWRRVDGPNRRRVYYHWPDVVETVTEEISSGELGGSEEKND